MVLKQKKLQAWAFWHKGVYYSKKNKHVILVICFIQSNHTETSLYMKLQLLLALWGKIHKLQSAASGIVPNAQTTPPAWHVHCLHFGDSRAALPLAWTHRGRGIRGGLQGMPCFPDTALWGAENGHAHFFPTSTASSLRTSNLLAFYLVIPTPQSNPCRGKWTDKLGYLHGWQVRLSNNKAITSFWRVTAVLPRYPYHWPTLPFVMHGTSTWCPRPVFVYNIYAQLIMAANAYTALQYCCRVQSKCNVQNTKKRDKSFHH